MKEKFLPIGTICTVKGINKKIMICGFFGLSYNGKLKMYDYMGIEYPEGMLLKNKTYSFNHTDIASVDFLGYEDENHKILKDNLLKNNISSEPLQTDALLSNFKFDENGVVIFDGSAPLETEEPKKQEVSNPFNQIYMKPPEETKKKGFSKFKFDKNGIVIAEETEISQGFKFDKNGVVIQDDTIENNPADNSQFKFDENGVVIQDDTIENNPTDNTQFKFDENGVVIQDGNNSLVTEEVPVIIE